LLRRSVEQKTGWLFVGGNALMFLGAIMNIWLPINKNLWTSSYSVFMAGLAMNVFGVFYWLVDVKGYQRWVKPFAIYGMNAITVFFLAGISGRILMMESQFKDATGHALSLKDHYHQAVFANLSSDPKISSLIWAIMYVVALYLVAYVMYRRKWFVRL